MDFCTAKTPYILDFVLHVLCEKIKTFIFKNLYSIIFIIFISKQTNKQKKNRSLALPVVYLWYFEIRHLKIQDQWPPIKIVLFFLFINLCAFNTKCEGSSIFIKNGFGTLLPLNNFEHFSQKITAVFFRNWQLYDCVGILSTDQSQNYGIFTIKADP